MAVVGSAFIEVSPDVRGFAEKLKKLLASIRPVLVVTAEVDAAQLARDASAAVELAQGAVRPLDVSFDVDPAALVEMTDTAVELAQGAAQALDIGFDVDPAALASDTAAAVALAEESAPKIDVRFDVDGADLAARVRGAAAVAEGSASSGGLGIRSKLVGGMKVGLAGLAATLLAGLNERRCPAMKRRWKLPRSARSRAAGKSRWRSCCRSVRRSPASTVWRRSRSRWGCRRRKRRS